MPKILVHVDLFTETGKWKYGFEMEVEQEPGGAEHVRLLADLDRGNKAVIKGTVISGDYHVVISDHPEQARNPTGHFFLNRLYTAQHIKHLFPFNIARSTLKG